MPTSSAVSELNRDIARKINEEACDNPAAPLAGKFVGIRNGQVVAVADDLDELVEGLHQVGDDLCQTLCVEVGLDYNRVQEIWGTC
jgi:hypothetical protein